jgi:hypothetical protein
VADTLWLPQAGMAELFQTSKQNVAKHLKAIFAEGELRARGSCQPMVDNCL